MKIFFIFCLFASLGFANNVKSNTDSLNFKINADQQKMKLDGRGLGIETVTPSANLHVNGNAIIEDALSVGTNSVTSGTLTAQNVKVTNLLQLNVQSSHPSNAEEGSMYVNSNGKIYTYIRGAWSPLYTKELKYNRGMVKVNTSWVTVELDQSYDEMVVVTTPTNIYSGAPICTRIRNASGNAFEIKLQRMDGVGTALTNDRKVYYFVVEAGVYNEEDHGIKMEAGTFSSNVTDANGSWVGERVTYQQAYTTPTIFGQVMSENDADFSIFWSRGSGQTEPADSTLLYIGKHVASDPDTTRADETLGYMVIESGTFRHRDLTLTAGLGPDTLGGEDVPNGSYAISGPTFSRSGIATMAAMDGGDGGVAFFREFESQAAVTASNLLISIDEDQLDDAERDHTDEQAYYLVFEDTPIRMEKGVYTASTNYETVVLNNTYTSPVILATLVNEEGSPFCVRINNASGNSFDLKAQHMSASTNYIGGVNIHYFVIEEGIYDYSTYGVQMEARLQSNIDVNGNGDWSGTESFYIQSYTSPVVLGNNQTENNVDFSTFWSIDGTDNATRPSSANIYIGLTKMASGQSTPNSETAGFLILETSDAVIDNLRYVAAVGADTVQGYDDGTYTYNIGETIDVAIATQTAMDGTDGSTTIFKGTNPQGTSSLKLASDEDTFSDAERAHANRRGRLFHFYRGIKSY